MQRWGGAWEIADVLAATLGINKYCNIIHINLNDFTYTCSLMFVIWWVKNPKASCICYTLIYLLTYSGVFHFLSVSISRHSAQIDSPLSILALCRWFLIMFEGSICLQLQLNWRVWALGKRNNCFPAHFKHLQPPLHPSFTHIQSHTLIPYICLEELAAGYMVLSGFSQV